MSTHTEIRNEQFALRLEREKKIIQTAEALFLQLLDANLGPAIDDAERTFFGDENMEEPECKIGFTLTFPTRTRSPKVELKVAWSVRQSDEAFEVVDDEQGKLPMEGQ